MLSGTRLASSVCSIAANSPHFRFPGGAIGMVDAAYLSRKPTQGLSDRVLCVSYCLSFSILSSLHKSMYSINGSHAETARPV